MKDYSKIITVAKVRREKETELLFKTIKDAKEEANIMSLSGLFDELDALFSSIEGNEQLKSIVENNFKLKFLLFERAPFLHEELLSHKIEEEKFYLDLDECRIE